MTRINFSPYNFRIQKSSKGEQIFDPIRKKWILITPEEWVRQHLIAWMLEHGYPAGRIAVEKGFSVNGQRKRFDLVLYNDDFHPLLLAECKQPGNLAPAELLQQIISYQLQLRCRFWWISNGTSHYFYDIQRTPPLLEDVPDYANLIRST
jgi:hypothetical protein